ncbi:MAG TPA: BMC domain-containing protein [bacterium]|nr:BMC domain-containing protein [bacterium]HOL47484.1 BMC domain-containing protein [bacterium]HPQ18607.1 BMC domain-containing protein [bacterium]
MQTALGLIELSSIAQGYLTADVMLKAAEVELVIARTVCSGKFIVIVNGLVGPVKSSVKAGIEIADFALIDSMIIPNIHPDVLPALKGLNVISETEALGVVESFAIASLIEGADIAVKTANVKLIEVRLAMALGGKAYFTITGTVADVTSSVNAASDFIAEKGALVNKIIIPRPRQEIFQELI